MQQILKPGINVQYKVQSRVFTASAQIIVDSAAVSLRNTGDAVAELDRTITLDPGSSLDIAGDTAADVISNQFSLTFGAGSAPRLEVVELVAVVPGAAPYTPI
jgi:hypothetical protein